MSTAQTDSNRVAQPDAKSLEGTQQKSVQITPGEIAALTDETVSYNAFTGSHYAWSHQPIERGMVVVLTGENRYLHDDANFEPIYGIEKSSKANDPAVLGVLLGKLEPGVPAGKSNPLLVAAVGNATCWVVDAGRDLTPGDYLVTSDVPGYAMVDPGTLPTAHVFAKVAERVEWSRVKTTVPGTTRKCKLVSVLFCAFRQQQAA